jgi:L-amino acid N-acyltransferase
MMNLSCRIRPFSESDSNAVLSIFNHYVGEGYSAFPDTPVSLEFIALVTRDAYGVFVAQGPDGVVGFGILRPFLPFPAFAGAGMVTYFVKSGFIRGGIGGLLLSAIEECARSNHIKVLLAEVSSKNSASLAFHRSHGFTECGCFHGVGVKFGAPFDLIWLEKAV